MHVEFEIRNPLKDSLIYETIETAQDLAEGTLALLLGLSEHIDVAQYSYSFVELIDAAQEALIGVDSPDNDWVDQKLQVFYEELAVLLYLSEKHLLEAFHECYNDVCPPEGYLKVAKDYSVTIPHKTIAIRYDQVNKGLCQLWQQAPHIHLYVGNSIKMTGNPIDLYTRAMSRVGLSMVSVTT